ncbi:MAG TPA: YidC/Oxa1 family membrane protein insertase [Gemmatimonadota bacterium]|nr:YidC/Oxa1 family membrane protein insertase [Candidatus Limnocylindrales bacterium]HEU4464748.1 YidC/Oxa1 family membrane protein insertase [Gemmatimonadota bacterium]
MTPPRPGRGWFGPLLLIVLTLLVVAACGPAGTPGASGEAPITPTPQAAIPLAPAQPTDPLNLLAWIFTPLFQAFFIALVLLDTATGNIAIAIVLMTILLRIILIPVFRRQTVSMKRTQMLAPEMREIQKRYKGDAMKARQAQQELYRERGINPLAGCLPAILQIFLLIPMYSVFSQGLTNFNPQAMLDVFGFRILDLGCDATAVVNELGQVLNPCLDSIAFGVDWGVPEVFLGSPGALFSGLSLLAIISAVLQLVTSRMALPVASSVTADDPNARIQRQMAFLFPFISLTYGSILPAGLFLYWIVSTLFSIVQQYLIIGWGGMFPLFGWTPGFARDHTPRFPVSMPPPVDPAQRPPKSALGGPAESRAAAADKTIRHRERGRQGRRGRRR